MSPTPRLVRLPRDPADDVDGMSAGDGVRMGGLVEGVACPICGETMLHLSQLNRHLDDEHIQPTSSDDDGTKDAVLSWFKAAQRRVAPSLTRAATGTLSITQQSIRGVEGIVGGVVGATTGAVGGAFELNGEEGGVGSPSGSGAGTATAKELEARVSRAHWQKDGTNDRCVADGCGKVLSLRTGRHHCRKCGRLHCDTHSSYQMKLSPSALPDPTSGTWCRVCEGCFTSRAGYKDSVGVSRSRTKLYLRLRKARIDTMQMDVNKLEKRLEKLSTIYAEENARVPTTNGQRPSLSTKTLARIRIREQAIVAWENDSSVTECPCCNSQFGSFVNRRHHCRLCGRVICGQETCSKELPLTGGPPTPDAPTIRACPDCYRTISVHNNVHSPSATAIAALYRAITRYRASVTEVLPKFNNLLMNMANRVVTEYDDPEYKLASKYRKDLMEWFSELDKLGKRVKSHPTPTPTTTRLLTALHLSIITFLQTHMFTLQLMPKITTPNKALPAVPSSSSQNDEEVRVLEEQRRLVEGFLGDALRRRKFEDAASLRVGLEELEGEISRRRGG
ncbi:FYVE zinc finger-domain-containing protein [Fimicolochytrium jonesii]|uniref:FYVE zinc finger-domain-containing protein n=1 Tax=Fimicolochytrium jonesii TaxID=1396493 RepID=UPI0022FDD898|nr:FYVE zinc finger-domain-containing protein [Fimicolochytrium jonesii]KAI8825233.1 FYVE zinc finger-domain-containing protein [Fimicolochytrium jonesii]